MCVHMTKRRKNAKNERKNSVPDTRIDPEWKHSTRYNGDGGRGTRKRIQKNKQNGGRGLIYTSSSSRLSSSTKTKTR